VTETPNAVLTAYHVLKDAGADANYQLVGPNIQARSAQEAIRKFADEGPDRTGGVLQGVYVAVPARSWKPVTVAVETKTTIKLG
jgi:hypothetical protein